MTQFYILWTLMTLYAVGSWTTYLLPKINRTLPGYVKPLGVTLFLGYTGWFLDSYTDFLESTLQALYTMSGVHI